MHCAAALTHGLTVTPPQPHESPHVTSSRPFHPRSKAVRARPSRPHSLSSLPIRTAMPLASDHAAVSIKQKCKRKCTIVATRRPSAACSSGRGASTLHAEPRGKSTARWCVRTRVMPPSVIAASETAQQAVSAELRAGDGRGHVRDGREGRRRRRAGGWRRIVDVDGILVVALVVRAVGRGL